MFWAPLGQTMTRQVSLVGIIDECSAVWSWGTPTSSDCIAVSLVASGEDSRCTSARFFYKASCDREIASTAPCSAFLFWSQADSPILLSFIYVCRGYETLVGFQSIGGCSSPVLGDQRQALSTALPLFRTCSSSPLHIFQGSVVQLLQRRFLHASWARLLLDGSGWYR